MADERIVTNAPPRPIRKAALRGAKLGAIAATILWLTIVFATFTAFVVGVFVLGWPAPPFDHPQTRQDFLVAIGSSLGGFVLFAAYGAIIGAGIMALIAAIRERRERRRKSD